MKKWVNDLVTLVQWSPTFMAPGNQAPMIMPDDLRWSRGHDASAGEHLQIQVKLRLLAHSLPPTVWPYVARFLTGHGPVPDCGPGIGDPSSCEHENKC